MKLNYRVDLAEVKTIQPQRPRAQREMYLRRTDAPEAAPRRSAQPTSEAAAIEMEPDPEQMLVQPHARFAEANDRRPGCLCLIVGVIAVAIYLFVTSA